MKEAGVQEYRPVLELLMPWVFCKGCFTSLELIVVMSVSLILLMNDDHNNKNNNDNNCHLSWPP